MMDLLRRNLPGAHVARFAYRAVRPLFDTAPFSVCGKVETGGKTVKLWAKDSAGWLTMDAGATLA
jgi:3-methylfumaryl-CoA hydratase